MFSFIRLALVPLLAIVTSTMGHAYGEEEALGTFSAWTAASARQQGTTLCYGAPDAA